jgi:hypothetical protein
VYAMRSPSGENDGSTSQPCDHNKHGRGYRPAGAPCDCGRGLAGRLDLHPKAATSLVPPRVEFRLVSEYVARKAVDWETLLTLPALDSPHALPEVGGDLLPRIQPVCRRRPRARNGHGFHYHVQNVQTD